MKKTIEKVTHGMGLMLALLAVCVMSACSSSSSKEEPTPSKLEDHLSATIGTCERVGRNLSIEFTLMNKSTVDLVDMQVSAGAVTDDNNVSYTLSGFSLEQGGVRTRSINLSLPAGYSQKVYAVVEDFDSSVLASSVTVTLMASPKELGVLAENSIAMQGRIQADRRVTSKGVQSPDPNLDFEVSSTKLMDDQLVVEYSIANRTGTELTDVEIATEAFEKRMGTRADYFALEIAKVEKFTLAINEVRNLQFIVYQLSEQTRTQITQSMEFSLQLDIACSSYTFVDNVVSFVGVGVEEVIERISTVVPDEIRARMEQHIPIYDGVNPPNIEGTYVLSPMQIIYDTTGNYESGYDGFAPTYVRFYNQDERRNSLDFLGKQVWDGNIIGESESPNSFISGEGDNFTVFFNTTGTSYLDDYNVDTKTALVISGTKTSSGVYNIYYAFVMVEKSDDPSHHIMDVGEFRVFVDGDSLAETSSWARGANTRKVTVKDGKITTPWSVYSLRK